MPPSTEKRVKLAGFEFGVAIDRQRADWIRRSSLYQHLLKPGLGLLNGKDAQPAQETAMDGASAAPASPPASVLSDPNAAAIWDRISALSWYHTIDLGHGVSTPGFIDNRPSAGRFGLPLDLRGKRCLDIGTYDGFWAFEMERRGAAEVIGIDVDSPLEHDVPRLTRLRLIEESRNAESSKAEASLHESFNSQMEDYGLQFPGDGFRLAKDILGSRAERVALNVYDLSPERLGEFDVVLISQLLLRLRDPQTVIENIFSVCKGVAILAESFDPELESEDRAVSAFLGGDTVGAWWSHSIKSIRKMMEVAGFDPIEEVERYPFSNRVGSFWKVILRGYAPQSARQSS